MKTQVFLIPAYTFKREPPSVNPKDAVFESSGLQGGLLVNCTTDEKLMEILEVAAHFGHDADVVQLKDDEPWPTIEMRRDAYVKSFG